MGEIKNLHFDVEYASEKLTEIPLGYVNKTVCGVGMTCVALENKIPTIIVVPTIYLIVNKTEQYKNKKCPRCDHEVFGLWGDVSDKKLYKYLAETKLIKIMCTYDSLPRVAHLLDQCRLVIDESNELLSKTKLKGNVIYTVFEIAEKHKDRVSFVSATPTPIKYMPEWVQELDQVNITWGKTRAVNPILCNRPYPYKSFKEEFAYPLNKNRVGKVGDREFKKAIVFINSVNDIVRIIKDCEISYDDCHIICGNSTKNDLKISKIDRLEDFDKLRMFTFITNSGFCGIDLSDPEALTFVISNLEKDYTMLDIMTDIKQACSRQRDKSNVHYGTYVYIYNQTSFDKTEEDLMKKIQFDYDSLLLPLEMWEKSKKLKKEKEFENVMKDASLFNSYTVFKDNNYILNDQCFQADKYFVLEIHKQYREGFKVKSLFTDSSELSEKEQSQYIEIEKPMYSYKILLKHFILNHKNGIVDWGEYSYKKEWINIIEICYKLYGKVWKDITYAMKMIANYSNDYEVRKLEMVNLFKVDVVYTKKEIKAILTDFYAKQGINGTAKAIDVKLVFNIKELTENNQACIKIISKK